MKKVYEYYKKYGLFGSLTKAYRKIHKRVITKFYDKFQKYQCKNIKLKKKEKIYLFSLENNIEKNKITRNIAETLNDIGYNVWFISNKNQQSQIKKMKVSQKSFMNEFDTNIITNNDICIYDNIHQKKQKSKKEITIDFEEIKEDYYTYCTNLHYITKKCNKKFYDNISIIVLNYNNKNVIFRCIETLKQYQEKYGYEIIIVDNQSSDGSYELLQKEKGILLYRNSKNGCSSGRNLGVKKATKDYVLFLDSDQWILHSNWLEPYFEIFEEYPNTGAIGWAGGWFKKDGFTYLTTDDFEFRYMPPISLARDDIGYLGSGGMMLSKKLFQEINGFDEHYDPTCYEDTDISLKIRNHGKELLYCPYLGVGHKPHQTTKNGSDAHTKLITEKGIYFVNKWRKENPNLLKYIK
ncbi:MAG: glycosyltransferase [Bacilli bacterium]|nr:glycosyltransferase [Bacilli bacterium]